VLSAVCLVILAVVIALAWPQAHHRAQAKSDHMHHRRLIQAEKDWQAIGPQTARVTKITPPNRDGLVGVTVMIQVVNENKPGIVRTSLLGPYWVPPARHIQPGNEVKLYRHPSGSCYIAEAANPGDVPWQSHSRRPPVTAGDTLGELIMYLNNPWVALGFALFAGLWWVAFLRLGHKPGPSF
jgi:hypothetical protein